MESHHSWSWGFKETIPSVCNISVKGRIENSKIEKQMKMHSKRINAASFSRPPVLGCSVVSVR